MAKKGLMVWIFSSLTIISAIHLTDAVSAFLFNAGAKLLPLYPFVGERLQALSPVFYFWASVAATFTLWGITCVVAFESPVEAFLNKILSDAKTQTAVESQLVEQKSEILDMMNETVESNSQILGQVADTVSNVRTEVKEIQPIKETVEKIKTELSSLRKDVKKLEERDKSPNVCLACGKQLLPEFKICPYCGENVKLLPEQIVAVKDYR